MDRKQIARSRQHGLTLIELLVVIVILALASTVVLLTAPPSRPEVREDAERFAARVQLALDNAVVSGKVLRLSLDAKGYQFETLSEGEWSVVEGAKSLARRNFDDRTIAAVGIEDASFDNARALGVDETEGENEEEDEDEAVNHIPLDPLGVQIAFSVRFSSGDGAWKVTVNDGAKVSVAEDE